jgi:hypothetical protein
MSDADIHFYFDPLCPFAWMTSKWVRMVVAQRDYSVDWRFISLRMVNSEVDYDTHFTPGYEASHSSGLQLLRVAARTREEFGRDAVGTLYAAMGASAYDSEPTGEITGPLVKGNIEFLHPVLAAAGLPLELSEALDDTSYDAVIRTETDEALALTGKDVGTPIIHFGPPDGVAFFGPVISRLPDADQAVRLWDNIVGLASFPGFAELKRSLRERPQLRAFGFNPADLAVLDDWRNGVRQTSV